MADEHYRWLDRDAAERLLNGEPLEDVDADTLAEADRLARALSALAAEPALNSAELPGEAAALAAFRKVQVGQRGQEGHAGEGVRLGRGKGRGHAADVGLVRLGRPAQGGRRARWGRPARLGLAAALAAGMIGGVAVAAGTGVLPTPFGDRRPGPAASVTAAVTPDRPLISPSPGGDQRGGLLAPTPDGTTNGPSGGTSSHDTGRNGDESARPGSDTAGNSGAGRSGQGASGLLSSCRDLRDGKALETGRRRALEEAAGGGTRVKQYCKGVLDSADDGKGESGDGKGSGKRSGKGSKSGSGGGSGKGDQDDQGDQGDDDGHHIGPGGKSHGGGHGRNGGGGHGGKGHQGGGHQGGGHESGGRQSGGHQSDGHRGNGGAVTQAHPSPTPTPTSSYSAL